MGPHPIRIRVLLLLAAVLNLLAVFQYGIRPWYLSWGATAAEYRAALPGDELVAHPRPGSGSTRVITIQAPSADVWPWLAQIGQDRAGFYSYQILEDLVGCEMPREERIRPEFQEWRVGDKLWMYPPHKLGGAGHARLARYVPGHLLAFATHQVGTPVDAPYDGLWNFVLEPSDARTSRLIVRGRAEAVDSFGMFAFDRLFFEPIHFVMERRMLEEIKGFAEGHPRSALALAVQPVAWAFIALLALLSALRVLQRRQFISSLLLFISSCALLQLLMFLQPAAWVAVVAAACLWLTSLNWSLVFVSLFKRPTQRFHQRAKRDSPSEAGSDARGASLFERH